MNKMNAPMINVVYGEDELNALNEKFVFDAGMEYKFVKFPTSSTSYFTEGQPVWIQASGSAYLSTGTAPIDGIVTCTIDATAEDKYALVCTRGYLAKGNTTVADVAAGLSLTGKRMVKVAVGSATLSSIDTEETLTGTFAVDISEATLVGTGSALTSELLPGDLTLGTKNSAHVFSVTDATNAKVGASGTDVGAGGTLTMMKTSPRRLNGLNIIGQGTPAYATERNLTGTVTVAAGTPLVCTGTGTKFLTEVSVGDVITYDGATSVVKSITSDTVLGFVSSGTAKAGVTAKAKMPQVPILLLG